MKVLIVGSGPIGVTTAYFLRQQGHDVVVLERESGAGLGASYANGALLTPSMSEPWNAPGVWRVVLASLGRADAAMQLRLKALPALLGWGLMFLKHSQASRFQRNALSNLRLALHSLETLQALQRELPIEYHSEARGSLRIFRDTASMDRAREGAAPLVEHGLRLQVLSPAQAVQLEPALTPIAANLAGAIHYQADRTGDAYRFCAALAEHGRRCGIEFHFDTAVLRLESQSGSVTAVQSSRGHFAADRYIIAAGSYSARLLHPLGIHLPIQPVKGYSITLDDPAREPWLKIPVVDDGLHAALTPLGRALRIAGTAEFAGTCGRRRRSGYLENSRRHRC